MTEPTRPRDRLVAGYEKSVPRPAWTGDRPFRSDPGMEALSAMRTGDPARFERLVAPTQKIALGYYEQSKAAAAAEPADEPGGAA